MIRIGVVAFGWMPGGNYGLKVEQTPCKTSNRARMARVDIGARRGYKSSIVLICRWKILAGQSWR